jgi:hypothetical protein
MCSRRIPIHIKTKSDEEGLVKLQEKSWYLPKQTIKTGVIQIAKGFIKSEYL